MVKSFVLSALAVATLSSGAASATEYVVNGGFEATTGGITGDGKTPEELDVDGFEVTGWTNQQGYNFIFDPTLPGSAAYTSQSEFGPLQLWTSGLGGNGGVGSDTSLASPSGGKLLGADGAFETGAITQRLDGLTVGDSYLLSFGWAAGQQMPYTGGTTEQWTGSIGDAAFATDIVTTPSMGFSPWKTFSYTFTADSANPLLSFLAVGTPAGVPPFSLLDAVSVTELPEPASWAMMLAGFGLIGSAMRSRRNAAVSAG